MKFKIEIDRMTPSVNKIGQQLKTLSKGAYDVFKQSTPVKSGNARRNTKLLGNTIRADYSYAKVLDRGFSKKAPRGMTKPTESWLKRQLNSIFRK